MGSVISIIPARGGSKGIMNKNIIPVAGLPLIAHTILDAQESAATDHILVSTDDPTIAEVSQTYGAEVIVRPAHLSTDTASSESALCHSLAEIESRGIECELVVFLQCTSPVRTGRQIDEAIQLLRQEGADSLLSVSPTHVFLWELTTEGPRSINYDYRNRQRRQDMSPQYVENGSIYIFKPWVLNELNNRLGGKVCLYEMPEFAAWQIDTPTDLPIIEAYMRDQI